MAVTVAAVTVAAVTEAAVMEVAVTVAVVMEVAVTVAAAIMEVAGTGTATHTTDTGSAITRRRTTTTGVTGIGTAGSIVLQTTIEKERSAAAQGLANPIGGHTEREAAPRGWDTTIIG